MRSFRILKSGSAFSCAVPLLMILLLAGCSLNVKGQFGWSSTDDRGMVEPEKGLLVESEYRLGREHLYFYDYETVWWIYKIEHGFYDRTKFIAALYEKNIAPEPVEIDLRPVNVEKEESGFTYIRQYYDPLRPGNYVLKIAHKSIIVDEVEFHIVPPGGPAALGEEDEAEAEESQPDEILRYSSVLQRDRN